MNLSQQYAARSGLRALASLGVAAAVLAPLLVAVPADAHMGSTKYIEAIVHDQGLDLEVDVSTVDAAVTLGLGTDVSSDQLASHGPLISGWLSRGLVVESAGAPCVSHAQQPRLTTRDGRDFLALDVHYDCGTAAGELVLRDQTVFDDDPDHEVFVSVHSDARTEAHVLRAGEQSVSIGSEPNAAGTATAAAFVREGAIHLVTGYDHVLFLLSLVLIASLAIPRAGLRSALRDIGWLVTAFTLGHSLSLVAATLGWLTLPSQWVEAAIAGSIVLVAGLNVARPKAPNKTTMRRRIGLAATFGLIHGFGFSSVLADVGLPLGQRILALASFNVGIELAQLALVAAVLLPLAWMTKSKRYPRIAVQGGSLAIAALGCVWLVERSLGL